MSYRTMFLDYKKSSRELNHRFRKFQKSKLPSYVETKPPTKKILVEVEVPIDDN